MQRSSSTPARDNLIRRLLPGLLLAWVVGYAAPTVRAQQIDEIVAVVNEDVVMASELNRQIRRIQDQLRQQGTRLPPDDIFEKQVLDRLILLKLQLQQAERTGIRIDDEALNRAIGNIARENNVTMEQFREILQRDGYDFGAFREDIRNEITIARLRQREVDNMVTVTDREIDNELATKGADTVGGEPEYSLSHILISTPEGASPEEIEATRQKAQAVLDELRAGADFAETAVARSDGQQALDGGDLGWRKASQLPSLFAGSVTRMREGELSELIRSPSGFHIILLRGLRSGAGAVMVRQTLAQHILIKPNELVSETDARRRLEQLKLRIEGGDDFGELARSHSDDRGSAMNGGDLGWVSPGDMVPEFEQVMNSLSPGETSQPFQSQFGWHIVRVQERRDYDGTEEVRRSKAREAIRARKLEEEREAWLRRLRDEAYVEYRIAGYAATE